MDSGCLWNNNKAEKHVFDGEINGAASYQAYGDGGFIAPGILRWPCQNSGFHPRWDECAEEC